MGFFGGEGFFLKEGNVQYILKNGLEVWWEIGGLMDVLLTSKHWLTSGDKAQSA